VRLVPFRYPIRSIAVRWSSSLFSSLGIGLTVAVLGGVLSLREGFSSVVGDAGRDDVGVYLRPGAQSEGMSLVRYPQDAREIAVRPEIAVAPDGTRLVAAESYLGIFLPKADGSGTAMVSLRGIEPTSVPIHGRDFSIVEGRMIAFGSDEILVGKPLAGRIANTNVGDVLQINLTPFKVVGHFRHRGAYGSELWADVVRLGEATKRPYRQRVVAQLKEGSDPAAIAKDLKEDKQAPVQFETERAHFRSQTAALGGVLGVLAGLLTSIMGAAAVLGAVNTMLAAVGARTREVGILVALGYRRLPIFLCFLFEAAAIGLVGGLIGVLLVLPFNGLETSTTNWNTFTEVAFAFRVTPRVLTISLVVAFVLGTLGGAIPAWRASRLVPTAALRRL
jgi:putative ABC transport system permease protein